MITEPTAYYVSVQHSSGCSSPKEKIVVTPVLLETPVITVTDGELRVDTDGDVQWFFEGQSIEGATTKVYKATTSGNYSATITQGNCEKSSAPFLYVVTSIEDGRQEFQLHAYPSPSTSMEFGIRVQSPETSPIHIQVVDMTGRVVYEKWFDPRDLASKLAVTELTNGLYSIIAIQGNNEIRKRIVIRN